MTRTDDQVDGRWGRPGPTEEPTTRERLLEAAAVEIAEVGWDAARTRSIAARAGVNPGVVHYHFSSMEQLLTEAARRAMMVAVEGPGEVVLAGAPFPEAVAAAVRMVGEMDVSGPDARILMEIMVQAGRRPNVSAMVTDALGEYRAALVTRARAAAAAGELPAGVDPEGLAGLVAALLDGVALHRYADPEIDLGAVAGTITRLLKGGEDE